MSITHCVSGVQSVKMFQEFHDSHVHPEKSTEKIFGKVMTFLQIMVKQTFSRSHSEVDKIGFLSS